jgi:hypothetical protein
MSNKYPTSETTVKYLPNAEGTDSFLLSRIINSKMYKFIITIDEANNNSDQLVNIIKSDDNIFRMIANIQINKIDDVIEDVKGSLNAT